MQRFLCFLLLSLLAVGAHADFKLNQESAGRFIKDFYQAVKTHDEAKIDAMLSDDIKIHLQFVKTQQNFTLTKADYLQQLRAGWHFAKRENFAVQNIRYNSTQAGLSGVLSCKVTESKLILDENISHEDGVDVDLLIIDDQLKITGLRTKTTF